ncbi:MAG: drug/metabolite transporter (DMT)-like permease [Kiritimatiellia bacterium]|jgi:drug/metabolite transporter (DMT)-like permease
MNNETKGMVLGLLAVTAFGLTLPATRVVVPYLDPFFIGFGRAFIAGICATILLLICRPPLPNKTQYKPLFLTALGVVLGFPILTSWAMQYVSAIHGGVVLGVLPLATAIFGVWVGHERPGLMFWVSSLIGSVLVVSYTLLQGAGSLHQADIVLLGAVIAAAGGYAVGAKLSQQLGGWQVICWATVLALPFVAIPAFYFSPTSLSNIPLEVILSFLYLALVSQLFGFFLWYKGLVLGGIARVSQIQLLQPFITLVASTFWLNEIIDTTTLVFIFLVVATVWLGKKSPIGKSL